ncbi:MAG: hypothetical protein NPIRA05_20600 [Nitrospirales bacterium]|nr:MAG: hypothetical protein NPIRA05_20600 [Nitrospirales bacterium]
MDIQSYMRNLSAYAYPMAEPVEDGRRFKRKWIVKTRSQVPQETELDAIGEKLVRTARQRILDRYGDNAEKDIIQDAPKLALVRVDDYHLVLEIICPSPSFAKGDAAMIGTWGIIKDVDEKWFIEALEGIPKQYWFWLHDIEKKNSSESATRKEG